MATNGVQIGVQMKNEGKQVYWSNRKFMLT